MALEVRSRSILRFGVFEVDVSSGELRKQGVRIKLQEQPFHVLAVLLERPGEVVTREELRNQNWPADTFVDFDNSLNTAINKLREALGDSADNPRFIETLPRRGYRLIAPVTEADGATRGTAAGVSAAARPRSRKIVATVAVVVVAAGIAGGLLWHSRKPLLTEKDTIVLGDFANSTGDAVFDGTLREGLSVELGQSPFLGLVSEEGIRQTLRMMERPANTRLTPEIAREVCQRTSSAAALDGSIALIGTRYSLILKAVNCGSGDLLASTEAQANDKSHVLDALGKAASEMRGKLGESLSTLQKYNTPLEQATTPSLEALQAYTLGSESADFPAAIPPLQRAIQLDPNFAIAYDELGGAYGSIGERALAVENTRKAFELRERVSELEKLNIEADYYYGVTGNLIEAQRSYALGKQIYPREPGFCEGLSVIYLSLGQYESALREHRETLRLRPHDSVALRFVAYTYLLLNRVEDAAATVREARGKGLDSAYFGHLGRARQLSRQASNSAKRAGEKEASAAYEATAWLREGLFGNTTKGLEQTRMAMTASSGRDVYYGFGLASAYAKNVKATQRFVEGFEKGFVEDTDVQFNYLPTLRARLALIHSNPRQAIDSLEIAAPYELGLPSGSFYNWPNLYPVYVRGEAYLAAHRGREAAAEFQKILDHRGIVLNEPIGALAHLQLGRAYAMHGDTTKARAAYQDFLTLWKDADPDIPILIQAKAEYAELK